MTWTVVTVPGWKNVSYFVSSLRLGLINIKKNKKKNTNNLTFLLHYYNISYYWCIYLKAQRQFQVVWLNFQSEQGHVTHYSNLSCYLTNLKVWSASGFPKLSEMSELELTVLVELEPILTLIFWIYQFINCWCVFNKDTTKTCILYTWQMYWSKKVSKINKYLDFTSVWFWCILCYSDNHEAFSVISITVLCDSFWELSLRED